MRNPVARFRLIVTLLGCVFIVSGAVVGTTVAVRALQPKPFDPLRLPDQSVLSRVPGVHGAATRESSGFVQVSGTKCNTSRKPVTTHASAFWETTYPPGTVIPIGGRVGQQQPGCHTKTFLDPIPPGVLAANRALRARGVIALWFVTATLDPEGANSVTRAWRTESFRIVP